MGCKTPLLHRPLWLGSNSWMRYWCWMDHQVFNLNMVGCLLSNFAYSVGFFLFEKSTFSLMLNPNSNCTREVWVLNVWHWITLKKPSCEKKMKNLAWPFQKNFKIDIWPYWTWKFLICLWHTWLSKIWNIQTSWEKLQIINGKYNIYI
jgi:hypothetical protein